LKTNETSDPSVLQDGDRAEDSLHPAIIVSAGVEGGGTTVYGRRVTEEDKDTSSWVFWRETTAMDLDDKDDEVWRTTRTEETPDLASACPASLFRQYPSQVHPEFAGWFRECWNSARSEPKGSGEAASRRQRLMDEWDRVIGGAEQ
jgi:hypothetical protein